MGNDGTGDAEAARALELAEGYLEDAENVLWEASAQAGAPETATDLEGLTQDIWELEHAVEDLKSQLRSERDEDQAPFSVKG